MRNDTMRRWQAIAPILLLCAPALADEPEADGSQAAGSTSIEVVVTTTLEDKTVEDSSASVTVVTADDIQKLESRSVADVLRTVAGLDVVQSGSPGHTTSVFVRGTDANQMLVMLDGVPLNDPYFGGYEWATLSTEAVERIEVVRGPFSALYGSDAIGGVINIITHRGKGDLRLDAAVEGGGDAYGRAQASLRGGEDRFDYHASASWRDGDGSFDNDDFRQTTGLADIGFSPAEGMRLGLRARLTDSELGIPFSGSLATPWRRYDSKERVLALPFAHEVGDDFDYTLELSHIVAEYRYDDLGSEFPYASSTETSADRFSARASWDVGGSHLAFGGEIEKLDVDNSDNFAVNIDGRSNDSWGVFVQDAMAWDRLSLTLGVRYDDHETFGGAVSPRASVAYHLGDDEKGVKLKAGYGQAFRAPTAGELYFPASGNPDLDAEESRSIEAGFGAHFSKGRVRFDLTYFDTRIKDLIDFEFTTFSFQNVGEARMKGAELAIWADLGSGFDLMAGYTKLDARDETADRPLKRRPDDRASLTLNYRWQERLNVNVRGIWVDERPDIDADTYEDTVTDGYTRVDLAGSYQALSWLSPYARVENALDEEYEEADGFPAPDRTFVAGLRFTVR